MNFYVTQKGEKTDIILPWNTARCCSRSLQSVIFSADFQLQPEHRQASEANGHCVKTV